MNHDIGKEETTSETELEKLVKEKIKLAKKLGIWDKNTPKEGYQDTEDFKRIKEIDDRLWELAKS